MIKDVEAVRSELKVSSFREVEALHHREVPVLVRGVARCYVRRLPEHRLQPECTARWG